MVDWEAFKKLSSPITLEKLVLFRFAFAGLTTTGKDESRKALVAILKNEENAALLPEMASIFHGETPESLAHKFTSIQNSVAGKREYELSSTFQILVGQSPTLPDEVLESFNFYKSEFFPDARQNDNGTLNFSTYISKDSQGSSPQVAPPPPPPSPVELIGNRFSAPLASGKPIITPNKKVIDYVIFGIASATEGAAAGIRSAVAQQLATSAIAENPELKDQPDVLEKEVLKGWRAGTEKFLRDSAHIPAVREGVAKGFFEIVDQTFPQKPGDKPPAWLTQMKDVAQNKGEAGYKQWLNMQVYKNVEASLLQEEKNVAKGKEPPKTIEGWILQELRTTKDQGLKKDVKRLTTEYLPLTGQNLAQWIQNPVVDPQKAYAGWYAKKATDFDRAKIGIGNFFDPQGTAEEIRKKLPPYEDFRGKIIAGALAGMNERIMTRAKAAGLTELPPGVQEWMAGLRNIAAADYNKFIKQPAGLSQVLAASVELKNDKMAQADVLSLPPPAPTQIASAPNILEPSPSQQQLRVTEAPPIPTPQQFPSPSNENETTFTSVMAAAYAMGSTTWNKVTSLVKSSDAKEASTPKPKDIPVVEEISTYEIVRGPMPAAVDPNLAQTPKEKIEKQLLGARTKLASLMSDTTQLEANRKEQEKLRTQIADQQKLITNKEAQINGRPHIREALAETKSNLRALITSGAMIYGKQSQKDAIETATTHSVILGFNKTAMVVDKTLDAYVANNEGKFAPKDEKGNPIKDGKGRPLTAQGSITAGGRTYMLDNPNHVSDLKSWASKNQANYTAFGQGKLSWQHMIDSTKERETAAFKTEKTNLENQLAAKEKEIPKEVLDAQTEIAQLEKALLAPAPQQLAGESNPLPTQPISRPVVPRTAASSDFAVLQQMKRSAYLSQLMNTGQFWKYIESIRKDNPRVQITAAELEKMQRGLKEAGFNYKIDGQVGPQMHKFAENVDKATRRLQEDINLRLAEKKQEPITVDGRLGRGTLAAAEKTGADENLKPPGRQEANAHAAAAQ